MRERGSVLALMPAAALVFVILGALAVDSAVAYLGEREVSNVASSVANDAATEGLDLERYYATGELALMRERVDAVAAAARAREADGHLHDLQIDVDLVGAERVLVRVRARVRSLFERALPNGLDEREVDATAEATAQRG